MPRKKYEESFFLRGLEGQVNFKRSDEESMNYKRPLSQGQE